MKRVLVFTTTFPQYDGDPRGQFILRHWEREAELGTYVRIVAPLTAWCRDDLRSPCEIVRVTYAPRRIASLTGNFGIVENVRHRPWRAVLLPPLWLALGSAVRREIDRGGWDRIVAHMLLPGGWIVARECTRRGLDFELFGHGTDVDVLLRMPEALRRRFARRLGRARTVWFPSCEKLERFANAVGDEVDRTRLGVESMVHVVPPPSPTPRTKTANEVLYLGRLIRQKGIEDLFAAVSLMDPPPRVDVAGDGPERRRLERLARRMGIDAHFHGFVQGSTKDALLRAAGVVCVPSREVAGLSEGAPLVIREALAHGVPVVATAVGGIPELCRSGGRVRLVPARRPWALSLALASALGPEEPAASSVC